MLFRSECNHFMRGVYLEPGPHTVEFQYQPPTGALYVSLMALIIGVVLLGMLVVTKRSEITSSSRVKAGS